MKVTVCELPNEPDEFKSAWAGLCEHVKTMESDLVLLPEMPFYRWLANTRDRDNKKWEMAVEAHKDWIIKLDDLAPAMVVSTRPDIVQGVNQNIGYIWESQNGYKDVHTKYYLPDEPGYWEASWYERGKKEFKSIQTGQGKIGFLICTELWFPQHAREYGKTGVQILVCPRATPATSTSKWVSGGQTAAVISGAFCLSSNHSGKTSDGCDFAGTGWIVEPEEGSVLGLTSSDQPFLTLDIDLTIADTAKKSYPRYVLD